MKHEKVNRERKHINFNPEPKNQKLMIMANYPINKNISK